MKGLLIILAVFFWIFCAGCTGGRMVERAEYMSIFQLFIYSILISLFSPLVLVYDLIRHGYHNDK